MSENTPTEISVEISCDLDQTLFGH